MAPVEVRPWFSRHPVRAFSFLLLVSSVAILPLLGEHERGGVVRSWPSLLPPICALSLVVLTQRVVLSLALAVLLGSALHHGVLHALSSGARRYFLENLVDPWHLMVCGFALSVLGMVRVTEASGGVAALVHLVRNRLASARATKVGASLAGLLVFFDDYANTFLIGSSMRPLCDRHGVSRQKLAYLVDSTAAPVAGLAIVSTWLSYEVSLLDEVTAPLELGLGGYALLLSAIPMRFYCIFALSLVFLSSAWERDMGPMLTRELAARARGATGVDAPRAELPARASLAALLPMLTLVSCVVVGLIIDGGGFADAGSALRISSWQALLTRVDDSTLVLLCAGTLSALVAVLSARAVSGLSFRRGAFAFSQGGRAGGPALAVLFCAWALGAVCKDLGTGQYLVAVLSGSVSAVWVPLLSFAISAMIALATGTSWGTMAIVMPGALPLAHELGGLDILLMTIAAVLDGAIFGDHCSPVSDTTVLSATACECDLLSHVATQIPYALLAVAAAATAYTLLGVFAAPLWGAALSGALLLPLGLLVFGRPLARPQRLDAKPPSAAQDG